MDTLTTYKCQIDGCDFQYATADRFGPSHVPSSRCESGKQPHCSCEACF